jgi:hypothetical protein
VRRQSRRFGFFFLEAPKDGFLRTDLAPQVARGLTSRTDPARRSSESWPYLAFLLSSLSVEVSPIDTGNR